MKKSELATNMVGRAVAPALEHAWPFKKDVRKSDAPDPASFPAEVVAVTLDADGDVVLAVKPPIECGKPVGKVYLTAVVVTSGPEDNGAMELTAQVARLADEVERIADYFDAQRMAK